ncbi:MAG: tautomerase family protein [Azospirillaceae bacterium]
MPVVTVTLIEGYAPDVKRRLGERLTAAIRAVIDAPLEGVTVAIHETRADGYMRGGQQRVPGAPLPHPEDVVRDYLGAMETRHLDQAARFLAGDFEMVFPGGVRMRTPDDLAAWASTRYRTAAKDYEAFESLATEAGSVVYCRGTLRGAWLDGSAFAGIRFIDRFLVSGGLIRRQEVWNDLGEARAPSPGR